MKVMKPEDLESLKDLQHQPGWHLYLNRLFEAKLLALQQAVGRGDSEFEKGFYHGLKRAGELTKWMQLDVQFGGPVPDEAPNEEEANGV